MTKIIITESKFDENTQFVSSIHNNHILMVGYITSFTKDESGLYIININQITGLINKTYDNFVKYLVACKYTLDEELAIWRKKDEEPDAYNEHEEYVEAVKQYVTNILL